MRLNRFVPLLLLALSLRWSGWGASVFTSKPDDLRAVSVKPGSDGSAVLQAAIDQAESNGQGGIVFVPSGRYRMTRTVYVWPGVRVFGYGEERPVLVLPDNTQGFQQGLGVMVMFTGARAGATQAGGERKVPFPPPNSVPPNESIADANSGTFYSAMSNIDFEIGDGNGAAVAIRFHVAQHAFLSHLDFHTGSGLAAIYQAGNEAEDLHFYGGRYGVLTEKTSPAWQFTLLDSVFEGQWEAAVREHEAGLTLVRDTFRRLPTAIAIDPHYSDQLWVKDCRFESVTGQAVVISNEESPLTEIGFENAMLRDVPTFGLLQESGKKISGKGSIYRVMSFSYGLMVEGESSTGTMGTRYEAASLGEWPKPLPPAIAPLPATNEWVNVRTLGVRGDGTTDDTTALQHAIETHRVLYFPTGRYVVRDTLRLTSKTVMIGLHPLLTQLDLPDGTPAFQGVGTPRAVVAVPAGGSNILTGLGVFTGGINPRAVGVLWRAGAASLMDDVRLLGGHGSGTNPYNGNHSGDPDVRRRWDGQYPSLWVADGGGGTFADIWTPDTFAQAGFYVSNTTTPGHVYELSVEHHVRNEIRFDHVENWDLNAPQTEEESGESAEALSLELQWSKNITIANYHAYRVARSRASFAAAVRLYRCEDIHFRNVHVNAESGFATCDRNGCGTFLRASKFPYENAIEDVSRHRQVREREFALLDIPERPEMSRQPASESPVKKLEGGFDALGGAVVDAAGKLYFVDRHEQRIYGWSEREGLTVERDSPLDPASLAMDKMGDLVVVSSAGAEGSVYSFRPGSPVDQMEVLQPEVAKAHPGGQVVLPVNFWANGEFRDQLDFRSMTYRTLSEIFKDAVSTATRREYVSPDGSLSLPAPRVFQQGPADHTGWRFSNTLDSYGLVTARVGQWIFVSNESEDLTYRAVVGADGALSDLKPVAKRGGESVAVDGAGKVYVANGQVFVYDLTGTERRRIDVPERPIDLIFGGTGGDTLFILSQHSLFAVSRKNLQ